MKVFQRTFFACLFLSASHPAIAQWSAGIQLGYQPQFGMNNRLLSAIGKLENGSPAFALRICC